MKRHTTYLVEISRLQANQCHTSITEFFAAHDSAQEATVKSTTETPHSVVAHTKGILSIHTWDSISQLTRAVQPQKLGQD